MYSQLHSRSCTRGVGSLRRSTTTEALLHSPNRVAPGHSSPRSLRRSRRSRSRSRSTVMTSAGTSLLLRSATKYLGVSKYHAMAEVGPSHAESSSQRSAASFASFSQPLSQHSSQDERPPSSARAGAASARACKAGPSDAASLAAGGVQSPPTTHGENCVTAAGAAKKKGKHVTVRRIKVESYNELMLIIQQMMPARRNSQRW